MVSLLCTDLVRMGDNMPLMLPGEVGEVRGGDSHQRVGGGGWLVCVPHSYANLQIFTLPIKPQCSLFILF